MFGTALESLLDTRVVLKTLREHGTWRDFHHSMEHHIYVCVHVCMPRLFEHKGGLSLCGILHACTLAIQTNDRYQITCDLDIEGLQRNAKANLLLTLQAKQQLQLRLKRRTRRAVVVVDMQIDFSGTGRLGTGAAFDGMIPIVNCVLNNHEWTSVVFLQLMRQYSDFELELRREAAQYVAAFLSSKTDQSGERALEHAYQGQPKHAFAIVEVVFTAHSRCFVPLLLNFNRRVGTARILRSKSVSDCKQRSSLVLAL